MRFVIRWIGRLIIPLVVLLIGWFLFETTAPVPRWVLKDCELAFPMEPPLMFTGPHVSTEVVAFRKNGDNTAIVVVDRETGEILHEFPATEQSIKRLRTSGGPMHGRYVTFAEQETLHLLDLQEGKRWKMELPAKAPASFFPIDGGGRYVRFWHGAENVLAILDLHVGRRMIHWEKDTKEIAYCKGTTFRRFEVAGQQRLEIIADASDTRHVVDLPAGADRLLRLDEDRLCATIATNDPTSTKWDIAEVGDSGLSRPLLSVRYDHPRRSKGAKPWLHHGPPFCDPDFFVASIYSDSDDSKKPSRKSPASFPVTIFDVHTGEPLWSIQGFTTFSRCSVSQDRSLLRMLGVYDGVKGEHHFSLPTMENVHSMQRNELVSSSLEFTSGPAGKHFVVQSANGDVEIRRCGTSSLVHAFENQETMGKGPLPSWSYYRCGRVIISQRSHSSIPWLEKLSFFNRLAIRIYSSMEIVDLDKGSVVDRWFESTFPRLSEQRGISRRFSLTSRGDQLLVETGGNAGDAISCYDLPAPRNWPVIVGIPLAIGAGLYFLVAGVMWLWRRKSSGQTQQA